MDEKVKSVIATNSSQFLSEISVAFAEERAPDFTSIAVSSKAIKTVLDIWIYSSAISCNISELDMKCQKRYNGGYQIRDIPVIMPEATGDTLQKLTVNYTGEGLIDEIYLFADSISTILPDKLNDSEQYRRHQIIDFLEQYRTAYNSKDLDFIAKMFKSNVDMVAKKGKDFQIDKKDYYIDFNAQYLRRLKLIFAANKYINIRFTDIEIQQHPQYPTVYSVVFQQEWNMAVYKDVRYVYFVVDFENEDNPIILFSTWYPKRDGGNEFPKNEMFKISR
jgi:hypothetical protein